MTEALEHLSFLKTPDELNPGAVVYAAIALKRFATGTHAGIILIDSSGQLRICHLRFHLEFAFEPVANGYYWVLPRIPRERLMHVADLCEIISERYSDGLLEYAFKYSDEKFDLRTGELLSPTGRGLTCATFVLAVFRSLGLEILDLDSWQTRCKDVVAQKRLVRMGRKYRPQFEKQWAYLESFEVGKCTRYRAEEVAAGSIAPKHPANFTDVATQAATIKKMLPIERH